MARVDHSHHIGKRYGRLTVVAIGMMQLTTQRAATLICKCDCGNDCETLIGNCVHGKTRSCGCRTHKAGGLSDTPQYARWNMMKRKWNVCDEWQTFLGFCESLDEFPPLRAKPFPIDPSKPIGPGNVEWKHATKGLALIPGARAVLIEYNGERLTQNQWSKRLGVSRSTIYERLRHGWNPQEAVSTPVMPKSKRRPGTRKGGRPRKK